MYVEAIFYIEMIVGTKRQEMLSVHYNCFIAYWLYIKEYLIYNRVYNATMNCTLVVVLSPH